MALSYGVTCLYCRSRSGSHCGDSFTGVLYSTVTNCFLCTTQTQVCLFPLYTNVTLSMLSESQECHQSLPTSRYIIFPLAGDTLIRILLVLVWNSDLHNHIHGKLQNLREISWLARVFFLFLVLLVGLVLFYLKAHRHIKKCLNFHGLSEQNWAALPLNCSKIGHSYEAFKYLFDGNISTPLLCNQKFFCRSFEFMSNEKFLNNLKISSLGVLKARPHQVLFNCE